MAGVDFRYLSVRVSLVDSERGLIESAVAEYPLHRKREDPEYATPSHDDHVRALASATRKALNKSGIAGDQVQAIALDTTGSSVIPVGKNLQPLGEYYLWCDQRAKCGYQFKSEWARCNCARGEVVGKLTLSTTTASPATWPSVFCRFTSDWETLTKLTGWKSTGRRGGNRS